MEELEQAERYLSDRGFCVMGFINDTPELLDWKDMIKMARRLRDRQIVDMKASGMRRRDIARSIGLSENAVDEILRKERAI